MKKFVTLALTLALVMGMSTTAFAVDETVSGTSSSSERPVTITLNREGVADVYSVDIEWDDMTFTYSFENAGAWNPEDHTYANATEAGWGKTTANIKVTNHSNADVNIAAKFGEEISATLNGVTATLESNAFTLAAGLLNKPNEADNKTATVTVSGTPNDLTETNFEVGKVTVTVSAT